MANYIFNWKRQTTIYRVCLFPFEWLLQTEYHIGKISAFSIKLASLSYTQLFLNFKRDRLGDISKTESTAGLKRRRAAETGVHGFQCVTVLLLGPYHRGNEPVDQISVPNAGRINRLDINHICSGVRRPMLKSVLLSNGRLITVLKGFCDSLVKYRLPHQFRVARLPSLVIEGLQRAI